MKNYFLSLLLLVATFFTYAQQIQSPSEFLGYELGSRFSRHHQVVDYFKYVANSLSNVELEKYGETNEHRGLYLAILSSQENMDKLEEIRLNNLKKTGLIEGTSSDNSTAIVWLSYNVHGNESNSTEASMQTIYELVTNKKDWLKNTVVIIDPCINPDGRDRYVNWYNQVKNSPYNKSKLSKEHHEPWPGGRANHYLFDLNRDWAWATQIESQQRLIAYNQWMPQIHVDFHEQSYNNPYYFAPAVEPYHEIITDWQREFQVTIGKNHAKYFDKEGWLYFTKESFDLLYPSYGDTYPTYMGAIGMTYEQGGSGSAGLGIQTDKGYELTLKDRLTHHTVSGLSTVEISSINAEKLVTEFENYFNNTNGYTYQSFVMKNNNQDRTNKLMALLDKHEIMYGTPTSSSASGYSYKTQNQESLSLTEGDLVVSVNQPKGKMVKALFEPQTKLSDSLTYDITAWALPYAYGLDAVASKKLVGTKAYTNKTFTANTVDAKAIGYIAKWNSITDAAFLGKLLQQNIKVRLTERPFNLNGKTYKQGSLLVLKSDNEKDYANKLIEIADAHERTLDASYTGFVDKGYDFGSSSVKPINKQRVGILSGDKVSSLAFGEVWYFFEQDLKYPVTVLDTDYFSSVDLSELDVLILPNGSYSSMLKESKLKEVQTWVRNGGTLIAMERALSSLEGKKGFELKAKKAKKDSTKTNLTPYNQLERKNAENLITGSIFKNTVDTTHPLGFGYDNNYYTLKRSKNTFDYLKSGGNVTYTGKESKPLAGFTGSKTVKPQSEALLYGVQSMGGGKVVYMVENPLFRAFWENGKLFMANAVFMLNSNELTE